MNSKTLTDFLNQGIEINFNDSKVIGMFVGAILIGIVFLVFFVWMTLKAQKIARRKGVMLFNIFHIILFGIPVAAITFIPFFQKQISLWCILTVILWIVPLAINIVRLGKYGILFSFLQLVFALLVCSVVGTVFVAILIIVALFFSGAMWAGDYFDFFIVDNTGRISGVTKTGKGTFVDSNGNYYMYTGTPGEYRDENGNIYRLSKR